MELQATEDSEALGLCVVLGFGGFTKIRVPLRKDPKKVPLISETPILSA